MKNVKGLGICSYVLILESNAIIVIQGKIWILYKAGMVK